MEEHLNIEAVRQDEESWKGSGLCKCLYMCWCVLSIAMCCVICMTSSDNTSEDHVIVDFANTSSGKVEFGCCQSLAWFCLILRIRIGSVQMSHGAGHGCRVWPQLQHDEEIHSRCDFAGRLAKSVGPQSVLLAICFASLKQTRWNPGRTDSHLLCLQSSRGSAKTWRQGQGEGTRAFNMIMIRSIFYGSN